RRAGLAIRSEHGLGRPGRRAGGWRRGGRCTPDPLDGAASGEGRHAVRAAGPPERATARGRRPRPMAARPLLPALRTDPPAGRRPRRRPVPPLAGRPLASRPARSQGVGLGHADLTSREERLQWCPSATSCSRSPSWPSWSVACACSPFATSRAEAGTVAFLLDPEFWARCLGIVVIDLTLAGDNALIIALAVRRLATRQQFWARIGGTAGAVALRLL